MKKAVFLDRDGVINQKPPEGEYVTRWEEMQFLPRVPEAIVLLRRAGYDVFVVTNQRGVAKGLLTKDDLESIHQRMCQQLAESGAAITKIYFCPHEKQPACNCRKPSPGMLLTAAQDHEIDLNKSWMIGDSDIDVEAGKNAGCKTVRIVKWDEPGNGGADLVAKSLFDAVHQVLSLQP